MEKINAKNFVDGYKRLAKSNQDAYGYVEKHVISHYANYELKQTVCDRIIDCSCYITVGDGEEQVKIFKQDSSARYYLWCIAIIDLYTDIDLGNSEDRLVNFNLMNEQGLIGEIIEAVGQREISEFQTVLDMKMDDLMENERSFNRLIDSGSLAIKQIFEGLMNMIGDGK